MKKIILAISLTALFAVAIGLVVIEPKEVSAAMPEVGCANLAEGIDKFIQTRVVVEYTDTRINPCTGSSDAEAIYGHSEHGSRYYRTVYSDGTVTGHSYQGYFGGRITNYTVCADRRAKVYGQSFGMRGGYNSFETCNTF